MNLPVADTIQPLKKFATSVKIKARGELKLNDNPVFQRHEHLHVSSNPHGLLLVTDSLHRQSHKCSRLVKGFKLH